MTKDEFKILVKGMKSVYSDPKFITDNDAFSVWYSLLSDIPYDIASKAVQKYMSTESFAPTPAGIRTKAAEIMSPEDENMSELEAWQLVYSAIGRSIYNSKEAFEKLPEICQKAVGSADNLKEWAQMDSDTVRSVEQSHFIRNYRACLERKREDDKIPEQTRIWIEELKEKQKLGAALKKEQLIAEKKNQEEPVIRLESNDNNAEGIKKVNALFDKWGVKHETF